MDNALRITSEKRTPWNFRLIAFMVSSKSKSLSFSNRQHTIYAEEDFFFFAFYFFFLLITPLCLTYLIARQFLLMQCIFVNFFQCLLYNRRWWKEKDGESCCQISYVDSKSMPNSLKFSFIHRRNRSPNGEFLLKYGCRKFIIKMCFQLLSLMHTVGPEILFGIFTIGNRF